MEANRGAQYTARQLSLLRGEIDPENNDEWEYIQEHANDVLPTDQKTVRPFSITGADLDRSFQTDRGNTHAGHIGEELEKDD